MHLARGGWGHDWGFVVRSPRSADTPFAWASGEVLLVAIALDSLAAHQDNVSITQWLERTGPSHGQFLAVIAVVIGLWRRLPRAWGAAIRIRPDVNVLVVGVVIAVAAIGWWFAAAGIAFLSSVWSVFRHRWPPGIPRAGCPNE